MLSIKTGNPFAVQETEPAPQGSVKASLLPASDSAQRTKWLLAELNLIGSFLSCLSAGGVCVLGSLELRLHTSACVWQSDLNITEHHRVNEGSASSRADTNDPKPFPVGCTLLSLNMLSG